MPHWAFHRLAHQVGDPKPKEVRQYKINWEVFVFAAFQFNHFMIFQNK